MSASMLSVQAVSQKSVHRWGIRPSWKIAALIGIPIVAVGTVGLSYYLLRRRRRPNLKEEAEVPSTPLEAAVALKNRGNKYFKAGQYAKAIQLYDEGLEQCPTDAITERAALYQNRAAAKENLRQYESALLDCTAALDLSPKYLKALNRRAHIYEKLEMWEACLFDVVACCIFEEFKNADNIISMDQALKKVGQKKAEEEWPNLSRSLPSKAFIRNYMSAFAWNPFTKSTVTGPGKLPDKPNKTANGNDAQDSLERNTPTETEIRDSKESTTPPQQFSSAYEALDRALDFLTQCDFEKSMAYASKAVTLFETALASPKSNEEGKRMAEGDETNTGDTKGKVSNNISSEGTTGESPLVNGHADQDITDQSHSTSPTSVSDVAGKTPNALANEPAISPEQMKLAKADYCKAVLLYATYLALSGRAVDAKRHFQAVCAEDSGAQPIVRVNALIKSACLSMSVDQDFAACLYDFQNAQSVCPDCPDVYLHRGQINLLADQLDEALHDLNTAVKLKPEFSIAQAQRLYTLYRRALNDSNSERATARVEDMHKLSQKYPSCLETHSLYAQVLTERGEFRASDEEFAKVIELAPDSGLAYAHRGLLQLRWLHDREAAYKWFSMGAKADPKCELVHELLGQLAVERGQFDEALKHFDTAIREAKTQNDLAHLIALREGVQAQSRVCEKYNIAISDVMSTLKREQQMMMSLS